MLRLYVLLALLATPVLAFAPESGATRKLEAATIEIDIKLVEDTPAVSVTHRLTIRNTGEAADFTLSLADHLVPEKSHNTFMVRIGDAEQKPALIDRRFECTIHVGGTAQIEWTTSGGATSLPHVHPLGKRELTVRLVHLRSYAALPANIGIVVTHEGLSGELFGRQDDAPFTLEHPAGTRLQDFNLSWFASTLPNKRAELGKTLESFKDKQPGADNRLYTTTLAHLVDLALHAGDNEAVAAHCETLATLEVASSMAITLCGPWAEWRRYVPWQLLRLRALEALGRDTTECAKLAVTVMTERWPAYLKAKAAARPFDEFDVAKFGSYWDYDWQTTRTLYARALEITGDTDAAAAVSGVED